MWLEFISHGKEMWALPLNQTPELILLINNLPMVNHCVASSEGKPTVARHYRRDSGRKKMTFVTFVCNLSQYRHIKLRKKNG